MKDPRLYLEKIPIRVLGEDIIEQIQQAQEDAYNQALLDVENITPEGWISIVEVKKLKIK